MPTYAPSKSAALRMAAEQFRFYEQQHIAKDTPENLAKAEVNRDMAEMCDAAANLREPGGYLTNDGKAVIYGVDHA